MSNQNLGDRIKGYEKTFDYKLVKRMPLIVRVDGRAFHTFTKGCKRPFDDKLHNAMINAAYDVASDMQGFKAAYVQSDEVTFLLTDYDNLETMGWFDYELSKIVSITAALMSVAFNKHYGTDKDTMPVFDSRAFTVPVDEVVNTFLWRCQDWKRNSLQMYSRAFFTHKELHKKNQNDMQLMLEGIGKSWHEDLTEAQQYGTFLLNGERRIYQEWIPPFYKSIAAHLDPMIGK